MNSDFRCKGAARIRWSEWVNGSQVTLTLTLNQDGCHSWPQVLRFYEGGPNEEGYSYTAHEFWVEDGFLRHRENNTSRDCDGRYDSSYERRARIQTASRNGRDVPWIEKQQINRHDGSYQRIAWERVDSSQRDYTAEAMGY